MARLLVLDWDQDRCHILLGNVARSGLKIERAAVWAQDEIFNLAQGEAAGKKLKDFLKNAGMPPAPVLICLPKQRILVKELRVPSVAVGDEPALVRFQAAKELLENLDDLVLDYAHLSRSTTESQILATAVRKDLFAGYTSLAKAAGLKLLAVTPRPFVLADLLARCRKIDPVPSSPPPEWSAVLLLGQSWAELTILHGQTVCFARSMANDGAIDSEVHRSLVMFATQVQGHAPQILYLFGQTATSQAQESLARTLQIPVTRPKVLADDDLSAGGVEYSSGIGLLTAWSGEKIAVNFVEPKEPKPPPPSNHRLWLLAAGGGVVMLMFFFLLTQQMLARTKDLIAQNKQEKESVDKKLKSFEQERIDLEAFEDWEQGSISWIDEIFELSKRFPYEPAGFHLTRLDANVSSRKNVKTSRRKRNWGTSSSAASVPAADSAVLPGSAARRPFAARPGTNRPGEKDVHLHDRPGPATGQELPIATGQPRQGIEQAIRGQMAD